MKKWRVVSLFWGVQVITDVIRVSLAVVAPTLMTVYGISPGTMGIILSGWQWTLCWIFAFGRADCRPPWSLDGFGWRIRNLGPGDAGSSPGGRLSSGAIPDTGPLWIRTLCSISESSLVDCPVVRTE